MRLNAVVHVSKCAPRIVMLWPLKPTTFESKIQHTTSCNVEQQWHVGNDDDDHKNYDHFITFVFLICPITQQQTANPSCTMAVISLGRRCFRRGHFSLFAVFGVVIVVDVVVVLIRFPCCGNCFRLFCCVNSIIVCSIFRKLNNCASGSTRAHTPPIIFAPIRRAAIVAAMGMGSAKWTMCKHFRIMFVYPFTECLVRDDSSAEPRRLSNTSSSWPGIVMHLAAKI